MKIINNGCGFISQLTKAGFSGVIIEVTRVENE